MKLSLLLSLFLNSLLVCSFFHFASCDTTGSLKVKETNVSPKLSRQRHRLVKKTPTKANQPPGHGVTKKTKSSASTEVVISLAPTVNNMELSIRRWPQSQLTMDLAAFISGIPWSMLLCGVMVFYYASIHIPKRLSEGNFLKYKAIFLNHFLFAALGIAFVLSRYLPYWTMDPSLVSAEKVSVINYYRTFVSFYGVSFAYYYSVKSNKKFPIIGQYVPVSWVEQYQFVILLTVIGVLFVPVTSFLGLSLFVFVNVCLLPTYDRFFSSSATAVFDQDEEDEGFQGRKVRERRGPPITKF